MNGKNKRPTLLNQIVDRK